MNQLEIDWQAERDYQIRRAVSHAEAIEPDWQERAYEALEAFCKARGGFWTSEDFRRWCGLNGFALPVPKALGGTFKVAARNGLIRKVGTGIAKQRHGSPTVLWIAG